MKFQQTGILLVVATLAMMTIGVSASWFGGSSSGSKCAEEIDSPERCTQCCNTNDYQYGDILHPSYDRYKCECSQPGYKAMNSLFHGVAADDSQYQYQYKTGEWAQNYDSGYGYTDYDAYEY